MKNQKRNVVQWAMDYKRIVVLIVCVLIIFGIVALRNINKNEFPNITIRQGVVVAVYPGASAVDVEQQVTKPLEQYIFTYKEVNKEKTKSYSRHSMVIVQVELNDDVQNKDEFWSKFKHGIEEFKGKLPQGVMAVQVNDDFGDSSAMLVTMESTDKTYRELGDYMAALKDSLRTIESVGRMTVVGEQKEQVAIYLDYNRMSQYGVSDKAIALAMKSKDFVTSAGTLKNGVYDSPIYVDRSINMMSDIEQTIVYSDPTGKVVKLKDVANICREYPSPSSFVTNNGVKCLVLSVEMKLGRSITDMGDEIYQKLSSFEVTLPEDVKLFRITDQPQVVSHSVKDFLLELLIAVIAVVVVVLLLMPLRVALVAASTIPITIFISLGLFYAFNIELNTVTLAALIVTLGMIVDNSIVIIDSYVEKLSEGVPRKQASIESTTHFFKSILTATLAISITFFPFLITTSGSVYDTLLLFPWSILIVLLVSLAVAELVVPLLQYQFIKPANESKTKKGPDFLNILQNNYNKIIDYCFSHSKLILLLAVACVAASGGLLSVIPQRMMPMAERNQFAVEIYLPSGSSIEKTTAIADSLENILKRDKRVVSIAAFKGTSSPRFHTVYAPQFGGTNYAQFIVNTTSSEATVEVLNEYKPRYDEAFPGAYIRFKQLSFGSESNPIEIILTGDNWTHLKATADSITRMLRTNRNLRLVRNDLNEPLQTTHVKLDHQQADRLGVSNFDTELALMMRYNSDGMPVGTIWQGDYPVNVCLKGNHASKQSREQLGNEILASAGGLGQVPLRQVAKITPKWEDAQVAHRNGLRSITIMAEVADGVNVTGETKKLQNQLKEYALPDGIAMSWGGEIAENDKNMPNLISALMIAAVIIFFLLVYHYKRISTALLLLVGLTLCFPGTVVGVLIHGELAMTCFLGFISLMGILVRNAIIMYDYADELIENEHLSPHDAILLSAKRRMRPIFLTSTAASMGVLPMIISNSPLWAPMGNVIFYGTLITMVFILTVLPIGYDLVRSKGINSINQEAESENED